MGAGLGCARPLPILSRNWGVVEAPGEADYSSPLPSEDTYLGAWVRTLAGARRRRPLAVLHLSGSGKGALPCERETVQASLHLPAREADLER